MDHDVALVLAGGLIGLVGSLIPLVLQRRWAIEDRRRAYDARALDAAVKKLMAWQDLATKMLAGSDWSDADKRLRELDALWESDFDLIPDKAATREMADLSREVYLFRGGFSKPDAETFDRLFRLLPVVIESAQKARRKLGDK